MSNETSSEVASIAARALRDPSACSAAELKKVAASALSQRPPLRNPALEDRDQLQCMIGMWAKPFIARWETAEAAPFAGEVATLICDMIDGSNAALVDIELLDD